MTETMKQGAVALIDALGFRGIWSRHKPSLVVEQLQAVRSTATNEALMQSMFQQNKLQVASFSDTLLIGGVVDHHTSLEDLVTRLSGAVASVQSAQVAAPLPLNYRGCISIGQVIIGRDLFIGGAVDDAATLYEQAQAAVIWLTPAARKVAELGEHGLSLLEWAVPLKGGGTLKALVVNPFAPIAYSDFGRLDIEQLDELARKFMVPFQESLSVDVVQKAQNSAEFLSLAKRFTVEKFDAVAQAYWESVAAEVDPDDDSNGQTGDD